MSAHFAMHHNTDSPASYDIIIDRENAMTIFRINHSDILDFLEGNEVKAEEIDPGGAGSVALGIPVGSVKGAVRLFDTGSCAIERWIPPVYIIQISSRRLNGTLHILKVEEGYSLRYVRSRYAKTSRG